MVLPFKPWYAALTLLTARLAADGFSAEQGIDRHFVERARGRKEILELETVDL